MQNGTNTADLENDPNCREPKFKGLLERARSISVERTRSASATREHKNLHPPIATTHHAPITVEFFSSLFFAEDHYKESGNLAKAVKHFHGDLAKATEHCDNHLSRAAWYCNKAHKLIKIDKKQAEIHKKLATINNYIGNKNNHLSVTETIKEIWDMVSHTDLQRPVTTSHASIMPSLQQPSKTSPANSDVASMPSERLNSQHPEFPVKSPQQSSEASDKSNHVCVIDSATKDSEVNSPRVMSDNDSPVSRSISPAEPTQKIRRRLTLILAGDSILSQRIVETTSPTVSDSPQQTNQALENAAPTLQT